MPHVEPKVRFLKSIKGRTQLFKTVRPMTLCLHKLPRHRVVVRTPGSLLELGLS